MLTEFRKIEKAMLGISDTFKLFGGFCSTGIEMNGKRIVVPYELSEKWSHKWTVIHLKGMLNIAS